MKTDPAASARSATTELMVRLAAGIEEGRAREAELEPEAAAARLVRHLSTKAAENDLGAVVSFFSSALDLAQKAMVGDPAAPPARDAERDSSYWLG